MSRVALGPNKVARSTAGRPEPRANAVNHRAQAVTPLHHPAMVRTIPTQDTAELNPVLGSFRGNL